jgi:Tol biopolymer transport system component
MARLAFASPLRLLVLAATAVGLLLLWPAGPARSAFPGANGKIVFSRCENAACGSFHLWSMDPNGANQVAITSGGGGDDDPALSPNGQRLAFQECGPSSCNTAGITVANADGTGRTPLTNAAGPDYDDYPAFSPDGSKIAFEHCPSATNNCAIDVMGADGSNPKQVTTTLGTNEQQSYPAWSPDGSKIAFQDCAPPNPCVIAVVPATGGSPVGFSTPPSRDEAPNWSPDGSKIAFDRCCDANNDSQIFVMNADGSNPVAVTSPPAGADDEEPAFSPDGSKLIFERFNPSAPTYNGQLDTIAVGGGTVTPVSTPGSGQGDYRSAWQPAAPQFASAPVVSGRAVNGQTLTATAGSAAGGGTSSLAFLRCDGAGSNCQPIPGAVASRLRAAASTASYRLTSADIGHVIKVRQTQTNSVGSSTADSAAGTPSVKANPKRCSNRFAGTAKRDRFKGTSGGDRFSGGRGNDVISGGRGADCLSGGAGRDKISGGAGNDTLSGGAGNDTISAGSGKNVVSGGAGNDKINVVNHKRDRVNCGKGIDTVRADRIDKLVGCERVKRRR